MIGIVIVTHGQFAAELLKSAEMIVGSQKNCQTVSVDLDINPDYISKKIEEAIKRQGTGDGVLVLTDMFGGTPSNISLSFHEEGVVEVLTGANLPMLIRALNLRKQPDIKLKPMAVAVLEQARNSIHLASELIKGRPTK
ncbi:MAG: PTS sugar transporter subunit IIA [Deltaproteobacteria bacterium]|jgi:PTS system mannose-specific IIA component|nr:PTS sugar transporter subunit IIA [Deltaproteobacteria bacterium]